MIHVSDIRASHSPKGWVYDEDPFLPSVRIIRTLTTPEQALAACLGWRDTTGSDPSELMPLVPTKALVVVRKTLRLQIESPLATVWTHPDWPPHQWPPSTALGLTGGPPFQFIADRVLTDPPPKARKKKTKPNPTITQRNAGGTEASTSNAPTLARKASSSPELKPASVKRARTEEQSES